MFNRKAQTKSKKAVQDDNPDSLDSFWDEQYASSTPKKDTIEQSFNDADYTKKKSLSINKNVILILIILVGLGVGAFGIFRLTSIKSTKTETVEETTLAYTGETFESKNFASGKYTADIDFPAGTYEITAIDGGGKSGYCELLLRDSQGKLLKSITIGSNAESNLYTYTFNSGNSIQVSKEVEFIRK